MKTVSLNEITQLQQMAPCPRCGELLGWYEKRVCKYLQMFEPSGESYEASNMERVRGGDRRYCMGCHKDITAQVQYARQVTFHL